MALSRLLSLSKQLSVSSMSFNLSLSTTAKATTTSPFTAKRVPAVWPLPSFSTCSLIKTSTSKVPRNKRFMTKRSKAWKVPSTQLIGCLPSLYPKKRKRRIDTGYMSKSIRLPTVSKSSQSLFSLKSVKTIRSASGLRKANTKLTIGTR